MIKVLKFGGSSLTNKDSRKNVINIIKEIPEKVIVVVSAMGRYPDAYATDTLKSMISNSVTDQERSRLLSIGETMSTVIIADELKLSGINAISLSSNQAGMRIENKHLVQLDTKFILETFEKFDVIVLPGFQGLDAQGEIEILESGDSDYSAVFIARKLGLDHVSIYSDVPGIFTADPKLIKSAKLIEHVSYEQALDLAAHKARIICKKALDEASVIKDFEIILKCTYNKNGQTKIDHIETSIKTMSVDFNYWQVQMEKDNFELEKEKIFDETEDGFYIIKPENASLIQSPYTFINEVVKVHFVGKNLIIPQNIISRFKKSTIEKNSFYVNKNHHIEDITYLHDAINLT